MACNSHLDTTKGAGRDAAEAEGDRDSKVWGDMPIEARNGNVCNCGYGTGSKTWLTPPEVEVFTAALLYSCACLSLTSSRSSFCLVLSTADEWLKVTEQRS